MAESILSGQQDVTINNTTNTYPTYNTNVTVNGSSGYTITTTTSQSIVLKAACIAALYGNAGYGMRDLVLKGNSKMDGAIADVSISSDGKTITIKAASQTSSSNPVIIIPIFSS